MKWPGRTIWDTRIQGICGILSARGEGEAAIFVSATFAQTTLDPPRVIVNPNRMYSIEPAIHQSSRFAINVMPESSRKTVIRLMKVRRREANKAEIVGINLDEALGIPFVDGALQTLFCEVERVIDAGDRRLYVARIVESRTNPSLSRERPLLFSQVAGAPGKFVGVQRYLRTGLAVTGALDVLKRRYYKLRPPLPPNIAANTYEEAGATEDEIAEINRYGVLDNGRILKPPPSPAIIKNKIGVCVVGTGWGSFHCNLVRQVNPATQLFVCGQNAERTARLAKAVNAVGYFVGLEQAVQDQRVQAFTLALPHDVHRPAVEMIASAGKHALVEKPIATSLADADAMIDAARRSGTILMVGEDMHFRPAIRESYRKIIEGDLGEPLYLFAHVAGVRRPRGWAAQSERMGGGVLMDMGVHYVRALRVLLGEPDTVFASRAMQIDTKISGEDSVQVVFSSRAGWEAHMFFSWASLRGQLPDIIVAGEKGTLHLWPGAPYVDLYPVEPPLLPKLISYVRPYSLQEKLMKPRFGRVRLKLSEGEGAGYTGEMKEFLACISEAREPASPPEDARRDLEIVLYSYKALADRSTVSIPSATDAALRND